MEIYEAVGYYITSDTAIEDIVDDRIYHGSIPETESTLPAINYFMVSRPNVAYGAAERPRFQISCRGVTPTIAMNLANKVKDAFTEIQEAVGSSFDFQNTHYENSVFIREPDDVYHVPVDVFITYIN